MSSDFPVLDYFCPDQNSSILLIHRTKQSHFCFTLGLKYLKHVFFSSGLGQPKPVFHAFFMRNILHNSSYNIVQALEGNHKIYKSMRSFFSPLPKLRKLSYSILYKTSWTNIYFATTCKTSLLYCEVFAEQLKAAISARKMLYLYCINSYKEDFLYSLTDCLMALDN